MQKSLNTVLATVELAIAIALFPVKPATTEWNRRTLVDVKDTLNVFWGSFFQKLRVPYRFPKVYLHAQGEPTPCGEVEIAHYCPMTNTVHLDMDGMSQLAFKFGDSAAYIVLAHEYGHSVQRFLGLSNRIPTRTKELQADCLAGAFFAGSEYAGLLERGDLEEAILSAFNSGDNEYSNPNHHGTPRECAAAFARGFDDPRACFN